MRKPHPTQGLASSGSAENGRFESSTCLRQSLLRRAISTSLGNIGTSTDLAGSSRTCERGSLP